MLLPTNNADEDDNGFAENEKEEESSGTYGSG